VTNPARRLQMLWRITSTFLSTRCRKVPANSRFGFERGMVMSARCTRISYLRCTLDIHRSATDAHRIATGPAQDTVRARRLAPALQASSPGIGNSIIDYDCCCLCERRALAGLCNTAGVHRSRPRGALVMICTFRVLVWR